MKQDTMYLTYKIKFAIICPYLAMSIEHDCFLIKEFQTARKFMVHYSPRIIINAISISAKFVGKIPGVAIETKNGQELKTST